MIKIKRSQLVSKKERKIIMEFSEQMRTAFGGLDAVFDVRHDCHTYRQYSLCSMNINAHGIRKSGERR